MNNILHYSDNTPILTSNFDISKFSVSPFDDKKKGIWKIAYSRYKYPDGNASIPIFQTDGIKMDQYGIPRIGSYYKNDEERDFIKVSLDPNQDSCVQLRKLCEEIDEWVVKNKAKIFESSICLLQ